MTTGALVAEADVFEWDNQFETEINDLDTDFEGLVRVRLDTVCKASDIWVVLYSLLNTSGQYLCIFCL